MEHNTKIKIYFVDGDSGGVVHYSNYLRYFEIGRIEILDEYGINLYDYIQQNCFFAVVKLDINYKAAAKPGDTINIATTVVNLKKASIRFRQRIFKDHEMLVEGFLTLALLKNNRPIRMPDELKRLPSISNIEMPQMTESHIPQATT